MSLHQLEIDAISGLATLAILYLAPKAGSLFSKAKAFYYAHTTKAERAVLAQMAEFAVPFVEREFAALSGSGQMEEAVKLVNGWLSSKGLSITVKEIGAAIESAWAEAKRTGKLNAYTSMVNAARAKAAKG